MTLCFPYSYFINFQCVFRKSAASNFEENCFKILSKDKPVRENAVAHNLRLKNLKTSLSKGFLCSHRVFISCIVISILFTCLYLAEVQVPRKVSNLHFFRKVEVVQTRGLLAQETLQKVKISQIPLKYLQQFLKWAVKDLQSRLQLILVLAEHCPAVLFQ